MAGKRTTTTLPRIEGAGRPKPPGSAFTYEQRQIRLAATGEADGQCESCGSYRFDGYPPMFHTKDCTIRQPGTCRTVEDDSRG